MPSRLGDPTTAEAATHSCPTITSTQLLETVRMTLLHLLVPLVAVSVAAAAATQPEQAPLLASPEWDWKSCGYDDDPVEIRSIEVFPDPPQRGANLTVIVNGVTTTRIEEGAYAELVVKFGRLTLIQREVDICKEARASDFELKCPVEPGTYRVGHTVQLPREIPPAKFDVNLRGYTLEDDDLTCIDLWIDFMQAQ